ncbi:MAG: molybdate ABC transporter substrate-binding protein [Pyrinomonadaceae bacterium]
MLSILRLCALKRTLIGLTITIFLFGACHGSSTPKDLTVAAAADLAPPFEEIGRDFQEATNVKVVFSFGSSGMLAKQIENGAPVDLFASANTEYVDQLDNQGLVFSDTKAVYARGRIMLWTPRDSNLKIQEVTDLARSDITRIAMANPEHAPYGIAAREALEHAGIWGAVKPKLVYGENIRQTLQYAQTGNVEVAIVALSLGSQTDGHWVLVPEDFHKPLDQAIAVMKSTRAENSARQFAAYVTGPEGRRILGKYGFTFPGKR